MIKKSGWLDSEGRYWKFGPKDDEKQIVWVVGKEIEETDYILNYILESGQQQRLVSVQNILNYKRIRSGGFKIEAAITINELFKII